MTKAIFGKSIALAAVSLTTLVFICQTAGAQELLSGRPKGAKARLKLLENQVDDLHDTLKKVYGAETPSFLREKSTELQARLDAIDAQLGEIKEDYAQTQEVDQEQNAQLDDVSEEVNTLWTDVKAIKEKLKYRVAGYENGFFIGSRDGKFRLTMNGLVRPYYGFGFQKEWARTETGGLVYDNGAPIGGDATIKEHEFGLANARVTISAKLFSVIHGKFEIDYGTNRGLVQFPKQPQFGVGYGLQTGEVEYPNNADPAGSSVNRVVLDQHALRFLDMYGEYAPLPEIKVRLGQSRVPFDRQTQIDESNLTFSSMSLMTRAYPMWGQGEAADWEDVTTYNYNYELQRGASFGRDLGLNIHGSIAKAMFNYSVGVFNGAGTNVSNDNRDFLFGLRLWTDPAGEMTPGMSDLEATKKPLVSVGVAFVYDLLEHNNPLDPNAQYNSSDVNITGDVHFKWYGLSLLIDMFYRHADHGNVFVDENGDDLALDSVGMTAQASYYIQKIKLEPGFRYSLYDADLEQEADHVHEITGILNYYIYGRNFNIGLEYRGLIPANEQRSYLVPWNVWQDSYHEISLLGQVAF